MASAAASLRITHSRSTGGQRQREDHAWFLILQACRAGRLPVPGRATGGEVRRYGQRRTLDVLRPGDVPRGPAVAVYHLDLGAANHHRVANVDEPKSHSALPQDMLTQPWETLRTPWSPTDHGAAWMYSPPQVSRIA